MKKKLLINIAILLVIAIAFFIPRFVNLDQRIGFDWDQEKLSYEVKNIAINRNLTLLGPRANNDKGFFLGPHLAYLLIPYYILTAFHPNALMLFVISYCILFFIASFVVISKIFNFRYAVVFLCFWAINFTLIEADIAPLWPILIPLGVLMTWFLIYKIYEYPQNLLWWLLLGGCLGFFMNMHFQFIFILFYAGVFIVLAAKKTNLNVRKVAFLILGGLIMFSPLILFDLRHNFFNSTLFIRFFSEKDPNVGHWFGAWIPVFSNVAKPFTFFLTDFSTGIFFYTAMFVLLIVLARTKKGFFKLFYLSAFALWISVPFFFSIYGKRPSEYYFAFLYPVIIISIIDYLFSRKLHNVIVVYLVFYIVFNFWSIYPKFHYFGLNFFQKDRAVKRIKQVLGNQKCDIAFNVPLGREVGYHYLFEYYGIQTIGNWKSCVVNINIPPRKGDEIFGYLGVTFPNSLK